MYACVTQFVQPVHGKQRAASQHVSNLSEEEVSNVAPPPSCFDTTDPGSGFLPPYPSLRVFFFASRHGTFDVGERRDPMIRTYVIIGEVLGRAGPGK